jgi:hypothetical protein
LYIAPANVRFPVISRRYFSGLNWSAFSQEQSSSANTGEDMRDFAFASLYER